MKSKWIKCFEGDYPVYTKCPFCGMIIYVNQDGDFLDYDYCPCCGENMECNPMPLTWEELKQMDEVPVYIHDLYNEGREGWYIISWDYRKSGQYLVLSSRHCNGFLSDEYGESWVAYKHKPKE